MLKRKINTIILIFIICNFVRFDFSYNNLGYIKIKRLGIYCNIVEGLNQSIIDKQVVGYYRQCDNCKTILAGHSIKTVFLNLHNVVINDEIEIFIEVKSIYKVIDIKVVEATNTFYINQYNFNGVILVTCMKDNSKRLLIFCEKKE
ncbi:MAG: sortase [Bacilli bacterium]